VVLDATKESWDRMVNTPLKERRIDVWWWGGATSRLVLLLAYLMKRNTEWQDATIRVITDGGKKRETVVERLESMLKEIRIDAQSEVVEKITPEVMVGMSRDATLVFLPLWLKGRRPLGPFGRNPKDLLDKLPAVAMALAAEDIELAAEADEGKPTEVAESVEVSEEAHRAAERARKEAEKAARLAERADTKLEKVRDADAVSDEALTAAQQEAREAREQAERAVREAEKTKQKAAQAEKKAQALGAPPRDKKKPDDASAPEDGESS
jgi:hypothetical protein